MRMAPVILALLGACTVKEASMSTRTQAEAAPLAAPSGVATATFALG